MNMEPVRRVGRKTRQVYFYASKATTLLQNKQTNKQTQINKQYGLIEFSGKQGNCVIKRFNMTSRQERRNIFQVWGEGWLTSDFNWEGFEATLVLVSPCTSGDISVPKQFKASCIGVPNQSCES